MSEFEKFYWAPAIVIKERLHFNLELIEKGLIDKLLTESIVKLSESYLQEKRLSGNRRHQ